CYHCAYADYCTSKWGEGNDGNYTKSAARHFSIDCSCHHCYYCRWIFNSANFKYDGFRRRGTSYCEVLFDFAWCRSCAVIYFYYVTGVYGCTWKTTHVDDHYFVDITD